ncbi:FAD-binding oxidoreductase [Seohaeicola nanhaiensis]|uniref:FAD-binding oxidoreductase n=1 Tax=Seohaeicola nanhaiensis TaxID=1387282 RepID=A0ABV9KJU5_9RHOB
MTYDILKSRIRGTVITVFDADHAAACDALIWNGRKPARQARVIVRAADAADVQEAVRYAAANGLGLSARTGGHHFTGIAAKADMVIDLGGLDTLRIDVAAREATIGPAATNTRLASALERHGLAFPVGHCGSVPMGGYLLGGGIGWNSNDWGFACHSVISVDVVLADGRLVTASKDAHQDIFWAVRGAGPAFFGIVTAYRIALREAPRAMTTLVRVYPASRVAEVAAWAEAAVERAPTIVEFTAKVEQSPAGPMIAAIATVFASSEAEAHAILNDFGQDAPENPVAVMGPMPTCFQTLYGITGASAPAGARYGVDCAWSEADIEPVLAQIALAVGRAPSPKSFGLVTLRSNARPLPAISAFSVAGRLFAATYGVWEDEEADQANMTWLRDLSANLELLSTGAYVGEADLDRPGRNLPTLSAAAQRDLETLRARHDPNRLFRRQTAVANRRAA